MAARGEPGERNRDPNPFEISRWKATRSSRKADDGCDLSHRNVAMKHLTPKRDPKKRPQKETPKRDPKKTGR